METVEITPQGTESERDFLEAIKKIGEAKTKRPFGPRKNDEDDGMFAYEREKEMRKGDYIKISAKEFKSWIGITEGNQDSLDENDIIKVEIQEIIPAGKNTSTRLRVKAGDVIKEIDASIFFNYGKYFSH